MTADIKTAFAEAIAHQKAGRTARAEAIYRRILKAQPDHPDALHLLGLAALHAGRPNEAVELIGRAARINPEIAPFHFSLGAACAALERYEEAVAHYERALALRPAHAGAYNNLAIALLALGRIAEGIDHLRRALAQDPQSAEAHNNLGNALVQAGRRDEALASYRAALRLRPNFAAAHDNAGKLLLERGAAADALPHFEKAVALAPDDAGFRKRLREARAALVPPWHFPMLNDAARNQAYRSAIERAVGSRSVVLDIGTGTGLLAMIAARAGARHVTACEMVPSIAEAAREIIAANGLDGRISLIAKRSTDLAVGADMAEKANLVIHEIFDNGVLGEEVVPVLEHARANLATRDARVLPRAASVLAAPVESEAVWRECRVTESCGLDLAPFNALATDSPVPLRLAQFAHARLAGPVELFRFDFGGPPIRPAQVERFLDIERAGACHAVALWMRIELDDAEVLDTGPESGVSHWMQPVQVLDAPLALEAGERLAIRAGHDRMHVWVEAAKAQARLD